MKFNIEYINTRFKDLGFYGRGAIHMYDTALILDGYMPKFYIPFIEPVWESSIDVSIKKILLVRTSRTIPYSIILKYNGPPIIDHESLSCRTSMHWCHWFSYKLPNGNKRSVSFKMLATPEEILNFKTEKDSERENSRIFTIKIAEYMAIARSLIKV